jgi:hypothetical protein
MIRTRRPRGARPAAVLTVSLLLVGVAACSDDDGDEGAATTAAPSTAPTTAPADDPIEVTAVDYAFEDLPEAIEAGTTLALRNQSAGEIHELVAMRLPDGEQRTADELVRLPEPELGALLADPPALVLIASPADESFAALGDGTLGEPGRYLLLCFIPTGADPAAYLDALEANPGQPPSVPGGPPHFTAGMYAEVTVR